jgi:hypothetical protein
MTTATKAQVLRRRDIDREELREVLLVIYLNLYWLRALVIDVLARWMPRVDVETKLELVYHAVEEARQMAILRNSVIGLGVDWDALDHDSALFEGVKRRYADMIEADDEIRVIIGMNLFSRGVMGYTELDQLAERSPDLFPFAADFLARENQHVDNARQRLGRLVRADPALLEHAREVATHYRTVGFRENLENRQLMDLMARLIGFEMLGEDALERALNRVETVFEGVDRVLDGSARAIAGGFVRQPVG